MSTLLPKQIYSSIMTYLLINADPFKVDSIGLYKVSPVITPLFKTLPKVHCLILGKGVP
jgi:hypothetical protein